MYVNILSDDGSRKDRQDRAARLGASVTKAPAR